ncbi:GNAT family N-acetyltransferase [Algiphilus aromaticivorans]|uniref:GNAT family N-acetyltransferase n=1 Tax=Algiphilus aromaticivorans TaxID=382454 RepID=UPI0005C197A8|nr:GNAT family N-acetyltransferase [Algiphilus aromaticivorans]
MAENNAAKKQPKAWDEVLQDEQFQQLPPDRKDLAKRDYFLDVVAPKVPEPERERAWKDFVAYQPDHTPPARGLADDPEGRSVSETVSDTGLGIAKGGVSLAEGAVGAADLATTPVRMAMQGLGLDVAPISEATGLSDSAEQARESLSKRQSPELQRQRQEVEDAEGFFGTLKAYSDNPAAAGDLIAENLPMLFGPAIITRAGSAQRYKAAYDTAIKGGLGREAAEQAANRAAKQAGERAALGSEAALGGGFAGQESVRRAEETLDQEAAKAAFNNEPIPEGFEERRRYGSELARLTGGLAGAGTTAAVTRLTGMDRALQRAFGRGEIGPKGIARRTATGAGVTARETGQETLQEGGESVSADVGAYAGTGGETPLVRPEKAKKAAAQGVVAGGGTGAVAGGVAAARPGERRRVADFGENPPTWADVSADPKFQQLKPDQQRSVKEDYFEGVLAPDIPEADREPMRRAFMAQIDTPAQTEQAQTEQTESAAPETQRDDYDATESLDDSLQADARQPWQTPREQFYADPDNAGTDHEQAVAGALQRGDSVPPDVLVDYPDLVEAAPGQPAPEKTEREQQLEQDLAEAESETARGLIKEELQAERQRATEQRQQTEQQQRAQRERDELTRMAERAEQRGDTQLAQRMRERAEQTAPDEQEGDAQPADAQGSPEIPDSVLSIFPDMQLAESDLIPLSGFTDEEAGALRQAGLVETGTLDNGSTHEGVNPGHLWPIRDERAKKLSESRNKVSNEEKNRAVERRAQNYDRLASEQDALGELGDADKASEYRRKANEIRKRKIQSTVPTMVTQGMKAQLRNMGYTDERIRAMRPQEAWDAINARDAEPEAADEQEAQVAPSQRLAGDPIDDEWVNFATESGTRNVPRADMPQIEAANRGALVNYLKARDVPANREDADPASLKPTQAEFSRKKVAKAKRFEGGDRAILVSQDGHIIDGHHQWLAKLDAGEPIPVMRLGATIDQILPLAREFPSSRQAAGAEPTQQPEPEAPERDQEVDAALQAMEPAAVGRVARDLGLQNRVSKKRNIEAIRAERDDAQIRSALGLDAQPDDAPAGILQQEESAPTSEPAPAPEAGDRTARITIPGGERINAEWEVVEAGQLAPAMSEAVNQARDRGRAASQMQVARIAQAPNWDLVSESPTMNEGAPTVARDDTVVGGNGRLAGLAEAYRRGNADSYRQALRDNAARLGLDPEQVAGMEAPVLIRRLPEDVDVRALSLRSNEGGGLAMSSLEQAAVDAERIDSLENLVVDDAGNLHRTRNGSIVQQMLRKMPVEQQAALVDNQGRLSRDGYQRLRNAVLYRAYGNSEPVQSIVDAMDDSSRNLATALIRAAPQVAQMRDKIADGRLFDADIVPELVEAVQVFEQLREDGRSVDQFIEQGDMLRDGVSDTTLQLMRAFARNLRSAGKMTELLNEYATQLEAFGEPGSDMFGDRQGPENTTEVLSNAQKAIDRRRDGAKAAQSGQDAGREAEGGAGAEQQRADDGAQQPAADADGGREAEQRVGGEDAVAPPADAEPNQAPPESGAFSLEAEQDGQVQPEQPRALRPDEQANNFQLTPEQRTQEQSDAEARQQAEAAQTDAFGAQGAQQQPRRGDAPPAGAGGGLFAGGGQEPQTSEYGAANKVFTKDNADAAREVLRRKLGNINAGMDPEVMQAGIQLAGYHVEAGARRFGQFSRAMLNDMGESIRPYLKMLYNAVRDYPDFDSSGMDEYNEVQAADIDAAVEQADVERSGDSLEPSGAAGSADAVGTSDVPDGSGAVDGSARSAGGGSGGSGRGSAGGAGVSRRGAADSREGGDQPTSGAATDAGVDAAGNQFGGRSGSAGDSRPGAERPAGERASDAAEQRAAEQLGREEAQRAAEQAPVEPGNLDNVRETLPFLMEGQQEDVAAAERRFEGAPKEPGMLFTNGTGTGKTFTGLGVVKRFARRGKNNILIVAPNDKIGRDWVTSGEKLGLTITALPNTSTAGEGIVVTTYANMAENESLADRDWDLIVPDEAHYLSANQAGTLTGAGQALRTLAWAPRSVPTRFDQRNRDGITRDLREAREALEYAQMQAKDNDAALPAAEQAQERYNAVWQRYEQQRADFAEQNIDRFGETKVLFLSATPFAYVKSIEYADGFLFNYQEGQEGADNDQGYNAGNARERFFMTHFGFRMRYNRLTQPDAGVDTAVMEAQFNEWLRKRGSLSSRVLDVDQDYERKFTLVDDALGTKIDEGLTWLRDQKSPEMQAAASVVEDRFKYLQQMYLLEALKARHGVDLARQHMGRGRKVVVFHGFNKGGGFHPFRFPDTDQTVEANGKSFTMQDLNAALRRQRPDLTKLPLDDLKSPIETFREAFGDDLLVFNGTMSKTDRRKAVGSFIDDATGPQVILVQSDAGREGISLHDTSGQHQRALINLGLPTRPFASIQEEGRIYRVGQQSNAIFQYITTGLNWEQMVFATKIAERASTAENLAMGAEARALKESFVEGYLESEPYAPSADEGTGGKAKDRAKRTETSEFDKAKSYYFGQRKRTSRDKSREGIDYFATPEPLGFKMVEWAGVAPGESVLEPSAGHGAIARFLPEAARRRIIEPSGELLSKAGLYAGGADLVRDNFENHNVVNKYDAVVMNPPFGHGGKQAITHLEKAIKHTRAGGRVVAIIPEGPAADMKFQKMRDDLGDDIAFRADIKLPPSVFERAGTNVRARVVVFDRLPAGQQWDGDRKKMDISNAESIGEFFDRIEDMELPGRPQAEAAARSEPSAEAAGYELAQFEHTQSGETKYVAKPQSFLGREGFKEASAAARRNGGYYSRYNRGDAVPGFLFPDAESRAAFLEEAAQSGVDMSRPGQAVTRDDVQLLAESVRMSHDLQSLDIGITGDVMRIDRITVPEAQRGTGVGTRAMREIVDYADANGLRIALTPAQAGDPGTTSSARLVRFYKQFGFKENTGPGRDFEISEGMVREPRAEDFARAYHGTPHKVDKFQISNIGTGEGAQAFGHGLYFAESKGVAEYYRDAVSYRDVVRHFREQLPDDADFDEINEMIDAGEFTPSMNRLLAALRNDDWLGFDYPAQAITAAFQDLNSFDPSPETVKAMQEYGNLYTVDIQDDAVARLLDWDATINEQPDEVRRRLEPVVDYLLDKPITRDAMNDLQNGSVTGEQLYRTLSGELALDNGGDVRNPAKLASDRLKDAGIPGLRYLDATSRRQGQGASNFVVWDENAVQILEENGQPVATEESERAVEEMFSRVDSASMRRGPAFERMVRAEADIPRPAELDALQQRLSRLHGIPVPLDPANAPDGMADMADTVQELFGRRVVWYTSPSPLAPQGVYMQGDSLFVNARSRRPAQHVIGHELLHSVRRKNPELYQRAREALVGAARDGALPEYRDRINMIYDRDGIPRLHREKVEEEFIADVFGSIISNPETLQRVSERMRPGAFRRLVNEIVRAIQNLIDRIRGIRQERGDDYAQRVMADVERARRTVLDTLTGVARENQMKPGALDQPAVRDAITAASRSAPDQPTLSQARQSDTTPPDGGVSRSERQTDTEAFRRWFRDSKVVDENGEPLVVYKGMYAYDWTDPNADAPISVIDRPTEFPAFNPPEDGVKIAGFFGDIDTANRFAKDYPRGGAVFPAYLSIQNPKVIDADGAYAGSIQFGESGRQFRDAIRSGEHDGVIIKNTADEGTVYVALRPEQIKSATGNRGTFDPNDPRIDFQRAGQGEIDPVMDAGAEAAPETPQSPTMRRMMPTRGNVRLVGRDANGNVQAAARVEGNKWVVVTKNTDMLGYGLKRAFSRKQAEELMKGAGLDVEIEAPGRVPRQPNLPGATLDMPESGYFGRIGRKLQFEAQDKFNALRALENVAERQRGERLEERTDPYMQEALYHGRTRQQMDAFDENQVQPLLDELQRTSFRLQPIGEYLTDLDADLAERYGHLSAVDAYLYARHAPEANKRLEEINPGETAMSGMSDQDAQRIMDALEGTGEMKAMQSIAKRVDAMNKATRDLLVESGLEKRETIEQWAKQYDHYVPMKGPPGGKSDSLLASLMPSTGKGFDTRGSATKRRLGRESPASDIMANVVAAHYSTIQRAEKNQVGKAMLRFAQENTAPNLWTVDQPMTKRHLDPVTGLVTNAPDLSQRNRDNVFVVKVDGVEHHIQFNEENVDAMRMAMAFKNLGAEEMNSVMRLMYGLNRYLSLMSTSLNPEFLISNFARDVQTAFINLNDTQAADLKRRIMRDTLSGKGYRAIRDYQKGKRDSEWARYYGEFLEDGAQTGWMEGYENVGDLARSLTKRLDREQPGTWNFAKRQGRNMMDFVGNTNTAIENGVRLSAYIHARKDGVSRQRAGEMAKGLTVNFNRKGNKGNTLNALYLFFNASIQGNARIIKAAASSPRARRFMYAAVATGVALDLANRMIAGDDEDDENRYDRIPDYVKRMNWIVMLPQNEDMPDWVPDWAKGPEGDYIKFPLPYGYNVLNVAGQKVGRAISASMGQIDDYNPAEEAMGLVMSVFDAFNPIGASPTALQLVSPTIADPAVQWAQNKNFAGIPIHPEADPYGPPPPNYTLHFSGARGWSRWATEQLNMATGGSEVTPGAVNLSPELIDHVWDFATGGVGRFVAETADLPRKTYQAMQGEEDINAYEVPFLGKLYGTPRASQSRDLFYDRRDKLRYLEQEMDLAREGRDIKKVQQIRQSDEGKLLREYKIAEKRLAGLRKQIDSIKQRTMAESQKRAQIQRLEDRQEAIYQDFNRQYRDLVLSGD